jgi:TolA-binding protein
MEVGKLLPAALMLLSVSLAGCVTSGEGDRMRQDIAQLRQRLDTMEVRDRDINEKVAQLRSVLGEATALLGRNSADLGARVTKNESDIAAMTGKVEEAKYLAGELQKQVSSASSTLGQIQQSQQRIADRVAPTIPEDKETLWKEAQRRLADGQREDARRFLRSFIQRFPDDARSPQGLLQVGLSFVQELKHSNAVAEFSNLIQRFPRAPEVPEAMWQLAESFVVLKFCGDAKAMYQDLAKRYPKSPRARQTKERLHDLQKIAHDKSQCTS